MLLYWLCENSSKNKHYSGYGTGEPWYSALSRAKSDNTTNKYNMNHALQIFLWIKKMQSSF